MRPVCGCGFQASVVVVRPVCGDGGAKPVSLLTNLSV